MAQRYVQTIYLQGGGRLQLTHVKPRPAIPKAPGTPSPHKVATSPTTTTAAVQTEEQPEPVYLDALIAKRREKARRMRQR